MRVPTYIIYPYLTPGHICNIRMDHTSILKFIGQKLGPGGTYSDLVNQREVGSVCDVLDQPHPRQAISIDSLLSYLAKETDAAGFTPETSPQTTCQHGYHQALKDLRHQSSDKPPQKWLNELCQNFSRPNK